MDGKSGYRAIGCGCKSQYCSSCSAGIGWVLRKRLLSAVQRWKAGRPVMLTLTLDPVNFTDAEEGFDYVRKQGLISRLVRELRRRFMGHLGHYFGVIEFTEKGWPHWHIMLDVDFIPHSLVAECWNSLGPNKPGCRHGMGMIKLTRAKGVESRDHGCFYLTKYIIKPPKVGYPAWLVNREGLIFKRYTASHGLFVDHELEAIKNAEQARAEIEAHGYPLGWDGDWDEEFDEWNAAEFPEEEVEPKRGPYKRVASTIAGRVLRCGTRTMVFHYWEEVMSSGEVIQHKRWLGTGNVSLLDVADMMALEASKNRLELNYRQTANVLGILGVLPDVPDRPFTPAAGPSEAASRVIPEFRHVPLFDKSQSMLPGVGI